MADDDDGSDVELQAFEEASDESEASVGMEGGDGSENENGDEYKKVSVGGYSVREDAGVVQRVDRKAAAKDALREAKGGRSHGTTLGMVEQAATLNVKSLIRFRDVLEPFVTVNVYRNLLNGGQGVSSGGSSSSSSFTDSGEFPLLSQPISLVSTCKMRDYQLKGMSWLVSQHEKRINSILADEMGLGKTLQTISFLSHILHEKREGGPFLVVVPLSVLFNWMQEFTKWCPSMKVQRFHTGDDGEVARLKALMRDADRTDVIVTTYDTVKGERTKRAISGMIFNTVILDEGHRIKNADSLVAIACANLRSKFRLILTGTPVQNNLHESWSLLNYLSPKIFTDSEAFDSAFNLMDQNNISIDREILDRAHYLMRPFVLRRLKSEVEQKLPPRIETKILCPMSNMQRFWIQRLLFKEKGSMELMGQVDGSTAELARRLKNNSSKLRSLLAQLRKASNHPYLFDGVEKVSVDGLPTQEIVTASGKMVVFEGLLEKLLEKGHRCVVFSQFTRLMDIVGDYLNWKQIPFARLDGSTNRVMREVLVNQFNNPNSRFKLFLLSTRAGGEGVNLTSADTVILFDSDWNPQVDNQAMARVHRIGQTRTVHVYRLVTAGTVEERIVQRAQKKLFLDGMINRGSTDIAKALEDKMVQGEVCQNDKESSFVESDGDATVNLPDQAEESPPVKRKRGRPPKNATASTTTTDDVAAASVPLPKKKRGRLPKSRDGGNDPTGTEEQVGIDALAATGETGGEEDNDNDTGDIFSVLKFGWNSVFSANSSNSAYLSGAELDWIIDRTRGLGGEGTEGTVSTKGKVGEKSVNAINSGHEGMDIEETEEQKAERAAFEERFQESQQFNLRDFDEGEKMVSIRGDFETELQRRESQVQGQNSGGLAPSGSKAVDLNNVMEGKRKRASRMVQVEVEGVGMVDVLKTNTYSMGDGPESVYDAELKEAQSKLAAKKAKALSEAFQIGGRSGRQVAGRDYHHMSECQNCRDGGELLICDFCPCAYHLKCLGLDTMPEESSWSCPHHSCAKCGRGVSAVGLLFRCDLCPNAFCEDCLATIPQDQMCILGTSERLAALGYRNPGSCCYIVCSFSCVEYAFNEKLHLKDIPPDLINRMKGWRDGSAVAKGAANGCDNVGDEGAHRSSVHDERVTKATASSTLASASKLVVPGQKTLDIDFLNSCKLPDLILRLNRIHLIRTEMTGRYSSLGNMFGFSSRFELASPSTKNVLYEALKLILQAFDMDIDALAAEEKGEIRKAEEEGEDRGSGNDNGNELEVGKEEQFEDEEEVERIRTWRKMESSILNFSGIPSAAPARDSCLSSSSPSSLQIGEGGKKQEAGIVGFETISETVIEETDYNTTMVNAFLASVRYLASTSKSTNLELSNLLCLCSYSLTPISPSDKKNNEKVYGVSEAYWPYREPRFRHFSSAESVPKAKLEELIAAFLVTLLPMNQIVLKASLSSSRKSVALDPVPLSASATQDSDVGRVDEKKKKTTDKNVSTRKAIAMPESGYDVGESMFMSARFLESFNLSIWDPNGTQFTGLTAKRGASARSFESWEVRANSFDSKFVVASVKNARDMWTSISIYYNRVYSKAIGGMIPSDGVLCRLQKLDGTTRYLLGGALSDLGVRRHYNLGDPQNTRGRSGGYSTDESDSDGEYVDNGDQDSAEDSSSRHKRHRKPTVKGSSHKATFSSGSNSRERRLSGGSNITASNGATRAAGGHFSAEATQDADAARNSAMINKVFKLFYLLHERHVVEFFPDISKDTVVEVLKAFFRSMPVNRRLVYAEKAIQAINQRLRQDQKSLSFEDVDSILTSACFVSVAMQKSVPNLGKDRRLDEFMLPEMTRREIDSKIFTGAGAKPVPPVPHSHLVHYLTRTNILASASSTAEFVMQDDADGIPSLHVAPSSVVFASMSGWEDSSSQKLVELLALEACLSLAAAIEDMSTKTPNDKTSSSLSSPSIGLAGEGKVHSDGFARGYPQTTMTACLVKWKTTKLSDRVQLVATFLARHNNWSSLESVKDLDIVKTYTERVERERRNYRGYIGGPHSTYVTERKPHFYLKTDPKDVDSRNEDTWLQFLGNSNGKMEKCLASFHSIHVKLDLMRGKLEKAINLLEGLGPVLLSVGDEERHSKLESSIRLTRENHRELREAFDSETGLKSVKVELYDLVASVQLKMKTSQKATEIFAVYPDDVFSRMEALYKRLVLIHQANNNQNVDLYEKCRELMEGNVDGKRLQGTLERTATAPAKVADGVTTSKDATMLVEVASAAVDLSMKPPKNSLSSSSSVISGTNTNATNAITELRTSSVPESSHAPTKIAPGEKTTRWQILMERAEAADPSVKNLKERTRERCLKTIINTVDITAQPEDTDLSLDLYPPHDAITTPLTLSSSLSQEEKVDIVRKIEVELFLRANSFDEYRNLTVESAAIAMRRCLFRDKLFAKMPTS